MRSQHAALEDSGIHPGALKHHAQRTMEPVVERSRAENPNLVARPSASAEQLLAVDDVRSGDEVLRRYEEARSCQRHILHVSRSRKANKRDAPGRLFYGT